MCKQWATGSLSFPSSRRNRSSLRHGDNTHWILARRVSNEIVGAEGFLLRAQTGEGYPVICCSLCVSMRVCECVWKGRGKNWACLAAGDSVCGCIKEDWRKRKKKRDKETRAPLQ